ncbi:MAG: FtsX-like permease family protein [Actinomycetota bacterium]
MNPALIPFVLIGLALLVLLLGGAILLVDGWISALRRPFLRRLAVRDATRRPSETLLVIAGSLLGTALITGSFIVGDTLDSSIRASATTQLGPVDEVVVTSDTDEAPEIESTISGIEDDRIDGVLSITSASATVATADGDPVAEPGAQLIEVDFDDARSFGGDAAATGISGSTPGEGEVALTEDLAGTLEVETGDEVVGYLYGQEIDLEVATILPRLGVAGYWRGFETASPNAFVAPGTFEEVIGDELFDDAAPPQTSVLISNEGGVEDGANLTAGVTTLIEDELGSGLRVEPVKLDMLDEAEAAGDEFSELFLAIGSFAIVAGILLLVNIFVMLAEERKSQLGMLRAVGMRRSDLVRAFIIEGSLYSFIASIVGAILGIGVGWAIVMLAAPIFSGAGDFALNLQFAAEPASIVVGLFVGLLIALYTVVFTSVRISRLNIIAAIRDLQEPKVRKARKRTVAIGIVLAAMGGALFASALGSETAWLPAIVGVPMIAFGVMPLLGRIIGRRTALLASAVVSLLWGIFGNTITDGRFYENGDIFAFVVSGVLLVFSAVILLSQSHETFGSTLRKIAASRLPLRLGLAYPLARKFRTGLTLGMYSLVIFTMVFLSAMSTSFNGQVENFTDDERGGFDLAVSASRSNPPTIDELESVDGVDSVAPLFPGQALFQPDGLDEPQAWPITGASDQLVEQGPPTLEERAEEFDDDAAVWNEMLSNPDSIIISEFFLQGEGGPPASIIDVGDTMAVVDPVTGNETERRVIGTLSSDSTFAGGFISEESARDLFGERAVASRFYIDASGSEADARQLGRALQGDFLANGVEADTFRELVDEQFSIQLQFFNLMQAYLALGLVVGIAGLGVVMVRSVRERRREIGVLRSLGFVAPKVRVAFLLESGFVALEGIVVGTALAIVTASQLFSNGDFGEGISFQVPWGNVFLLTGAALIASLIATAWPAQQASRIAPAVALRTAE